MNDNPIQRILVPTDMSDFATLALDYALLFQKKRGSEITLLYAEEFAFLLTAEYPLGYYFENSNAAKGHAQELLRNYARRLVPDMAGIRTLVVDDSPARAIVRTADDIRADLIIMGTHGRHGLRGTLLGSVTERVLRETSTPLMTVIPPRFAAEREIKIGTIICPVNFTDVAKQALEYSCSLAQTFNAALIVMNVAESFETSPASIEMRFSRWVDPLVRGRTKYQQVFVGGDPAARVLEVADQTKADLIVVGAQHTRFSDATVIGTTTERITRFARQPVLTVMRKPVSTRQEKPEEVAAFA